MMPPDDPDVRRWIAMLNGRPFGIAIQDYDPHAEPGHHFGHLSRGTRGIDQYIGPPDFLGQGHGTRFIAQHLRRLFAEGAPVVAIDPHPDNARAIHVYEKLGFRPAGPVQDTQWGTVLPMLIRAGEGAGAA